MRDDEIPDEPKLDHESDRRRRYKGSTAEVVQHMGEVRSLRSRDRATNRRKAVGEDAFGKTERGTEVRARFVAREFMEEQFIDYLFVHPDSATRFNDDAALKREQET